jgi:hypothetical protein
MAEATNVRNRGNPRLADAKNLTFVTTPSFLRRETQEFPMLRAAIIALPFLFAAHAALAEGCPSDAPVPQISIEDSTTPISYDYTKTAKQIQQLAGINSKEVIERGLTMTELSRGFKVNFLVYRLRSGDVCVLPALATLRLGFQMTKVYIQSEYAIGSCQSNAILKHENTHVANAWESLRQHMPGITAALRRSTAYASAVGPDAAAAQQAVLNMISNAVMPEIDAASADQTSLDRRLDSPASIQGTVDSCPSW